MTVPRPTALDLFSGCGGGSVGFIAAGFLVAGAVEIDAHAAASYESLTGVRPTLADVRKVGRADLTTSPSGEVTLLFGCPPCQSFTILRRGGKTVPRDQIRNALPMEYLRLVEEIRPRHLAFENVPGFSEGRWADAFANFTTRLEVLGYRCVSDVVDAADYGVPQHRRRLLVVASRVAEPTLPTATHGPGRLPYMTVRQAIGHLPSLASGERDPSDPMHYARRHKAIAVERLTHVPAGGGRADLPPRLRLACHKDHRGHFDIYGRMRWDAPAPTLTSGCTNMTRGRFAHPEQHRAITLREAMLLQAFPASAALIGGVEAGSLQVGNAVPPLLAQRIGEAVLEMERKPSMRNQRS